MPIIVTKPDGTNACKIYYDSSNARIVMESLSADPINISGDMNVSGNIQVGGTTVIDSSRNLVGINNVKQSLYMGEVAGDFQIGVYNDISTGPGIRFFGPQHDKWPSQVYLYLSGPESKGKFVITKYDTTNSVWRPVAEFRPPDVSSIALELEGGLNIKSVGLQVGGTTVIDSSRNVIAEDLRFGWSVKDIGYGKFQSDGSLLHLLFGFLGNLLAFESPLSIEYYDFSSGAWTSWDVDAKKLTDCKDTTGVTADYDHRRWRVSYNVGSYRVLEGLVLFFGVNKYVDNIHLTVEAATASDFSDATVICDTDLGGPYTSIVVVRFSENGYNKPYIRITFDITFSDTSGTCTVNQIVLLQTRSTHGIFVGKHIPIDWDTSWYIDITGLKVGGTTVIDSSRNLVNVGSITASGLITRTGTPAYDVLKATATNYDWYMRITASGCLEFDTYDKNAGARVWGLLAISPDGTWIKWKGAVKNSIVADKTGTADSSTTLYNSYAIKLRGSYWDGSAAQDYDISLENIMLDTSPTAKLSIKFAGNERVYIKSNGVIKLLSGDYGGFIVPYAVNGGDIQLRANVDENGNQINTSYPSVVLRVCGKYDEVSIWRIPAGGKSLSKIATFHGSSAMWDTAGGYAVGGTTVIDSSRNLVNISSLSFVKASDEVKITLEALDADDTNTTRNSPIVKFIGKYWDGSASQSVDASIQHVVIDTSPTSKISFSIGGSEKAYIKSDGSLNIAGNLMIGETTVIDSSRNLMGINRVKQGLAFDKGTETVSLSLYSYSTDTTWRNFIVSYDKAEDWGYYIIFKAGDTGTVGSNRMFSFEFKDIANNVWYIPFQIYPDKVVSHKVFNAVSGIQINGTTVISSDRVLQNVNIDRATTDLPPCKVLEDRSEYSVTAGISTGWTWQLATNTYIDSVVGYKQVRVICEIRCEYGVGGGVRIRDDAGNNLWSASRSSTDYVEVDSGWVDLVGDTKKLYVDVGAYNDGEQQDKGYLRLIRIYCR